MLKVLQACRGHRRTSNLLRRRDYCSLEFRLRVSGPSGAGRSLVIGENARLRRKRGGFRTVQTSKRRRWKTCRPAAISSALEPQGRPSNARQTLCWRRVTVHLHLNRRQLLNVLLRGDDEALPSCGWFITRVTPPRQSEESEPSGPAYCLSTPG